MEDIWTEIFGWCLFNGSALKATCKDFYRIISAATSRRKPIIKSYTLGDEVISFTRQEIILPNVNRVMTTTGRFKILHKPNKLRIYEKTDSQIECRHYNGKGDRLGYSWTSYGRENNAPELQIFRITEGVVICVVDESGRLTGQPLADVGAKLLQALIPISSDFKEFKHATKKARFVREEGWFCAAKNLKFLGAEKPRFIMHNSERVIHHAGRLYNSESSRQISSVLEYYSIRRINDVWESC